MSGRDEAVLQRDHTKPPHRFVAVVRDQFVQERPYIVDHLRVVAREQLEGEQRRTPNRRALVVEAAPQELDLRAEPELADRAVRDGALAKIGRPRGALELFVPLRAQLREAALVAFGRERVGLNGGVGERHRPLG